MIISIHFVEKACGGCELVNEFAIDGSLQQTDGKGETERAATNSSGQGRAQNRRVEFVKF